MNHVSQNQTYCQSCGMPMQGDELHGTEANGVKTDEYCMYCYENGSFKSPDQTMKDMIEDCVPFMTKEGMTEQQARSILEAQLPQLKRWRAPTGA
jgi:hypothetical protein